MAPTTGDQPISTLVIGDVVLAYDEASGELGYFAVIDTIVHENPVVQYLTIDGETIVTTPNHPFKTSTGEWVAAGKLQAGDTILTAQGDTGIVEASTFAYAPQPVYNLTVATAHTYFVGEGQWLVHNACVMFNRRQVQKKFKHAPDFGITGNYNTNNHEAFVQALNAHIQGTNTQVIQGTYRGRSAIHYYDPTTDLIVFTQPNGKFWAGWQIGGKQKANFLATGDLR